MVDGNLGNYHEHAIVCVQVGIGKKKNDEYYANLKKYEYLTNKKTKNDLQRVERARFAAGHT